MLSVHRTLLCGLYSNEFYGTAVFLAVKTKLKVKIAIGKGRKRVCKKGEHHMNAHFKDN